MVTKAAKLFGYVFLAIGVLGFVPGITTDNHLLGIFHVDALHNVIHLASGAVALWAASAGPATARRYFQIFAFVYGLVTLLGLLAGDDDILGVLANNMADVVLHLLITVGSLYFGFVAKDDNTVSSAA